MTTLFGHTLTQQQLSELAGDISQVAGIRLMTLSEGNEAGVRIADVRTGSGLRFQVNIDRGMDISLAEFKGIPLAWRSPAGDVHPSFFEPDAKGWLRTFPGGLITGCGMASAGAPSEDEGVQFGLHGRMSHIPATGVSTTTEWKDTTCRFILSGCVREHLQFSYHLSLHRTVTVALGTSTIVLRDRVRNEGDTRTPLMMLYHCNIGWPVVSPDAQLVLRETGVRPRDADANAGLGRERHCDPPLSGYREQVFYHDLVPDTEGYTCAAIMNRSLGLGVFVRARHRELPFFTQWKMMGKGTYVVGLEPGNCLVEGRAKERAAGRLSFLEPGEEREFSLECGVLNGDAELNTFAQRHG
jgi:hypothetical protein